MSYLTDSVVVTVVSVVPFLVIVVVVVLEDERNNDSELLRQLLTLHISHAERVKRICECSPCTSTGVALL